MKKYNGLIAGLVVTGWFYVAEALLLYSPWFSYVSPNAFLQQLVLFLIPVLSGELSWLFLKKDTVKEFGKAYGIYLATSVVFVLLFEFCGLALQLHTWMTGSEGFEAAERILSGVLLFTHMFACAVGAVVAGICSALKQKNKKL